MEDDWEIDKWESDSDWGSDHPLMVMRDEDELWREWKRDRCTALDGLERE